MRLEVKLGVWLLTDGGGEVVGRAGKARGEATIVTEPNRTDFR